MDGSRGFKRPPSNVPCELKALAQSMAEQCQAFPEDSKISFERILRYWIGEGLVPAHDGDDPRADAFSLLNKLWERSFIESNEEVSDLCGSSYMM
ncbi:unnamed protein product [Sphagnum tenellum]